MGSNTFGKHFSLTTFGESHGPAIGGVIDGCPSGLALDREDIQQALNRRRPGQSAYTTTRSEKDQVEVLSGVFEGKTTGGPIGLLIRNEDARSHDYESIKNTYRPGHGDFTYHMKYGHYDYRGGGRSSARETALRVAAGAIAEKLLQERANITLTAGLVQMGPIVSSVQDFTSEQTHNPFFCPDPQACAQMATLIDTLRAEGDSIGAKVRAIGRGIPVGLGEPIYDKLDAALAGAMMSINAVKGVSIGSGFQAVEHRGSEHRDLQDHAGFLTNHAGGVLAGISNGADLVVDVAIKPPSSIAQTVRTLDKEGAMSALSVKGRHDPCVGIRAVPVVQAMMALVLADNWLIFNGTKHSDRAE